MATPAITSRVPALVAALAFACSLLACGSSPTTPAARGSADITVRALTAVVPSTVKITLHSPSVLANPLRLTLTQKGEQFQRLIDNLPLADDYVFTAEAFDQSGAVLAHGVASGVIISKGSRAKVIIYLNQATQQPPYTNASPLLDSITLSASSVLPEGGVTLAATAHDPDAGQTATLRFTWLPAAGCGAISDANTVPGTDGDHPSQSRASWTAPQVLGDCQITVTVTDILHLSNSASFTIAVSSLDTSSATVVAVFNGAPEIAGLTADPAQIYSDGPTGGLLAVLATGPDSVPLTYAWTTPAGSPCTVDFGTPAEASTTFTISTTAAEATSCTFLVAVSAGPWPDNSFARNTSTASVTLALTSALVVRLPPIFGLAYQSENSATGGTVVVFGAIAADPTAGTLTFDWSASAGDAPMAADPASLNLDPAFVTASTWTVPPGAETATDNLTVSVTATSSTTGLQSSFTFALVPANLQ
jgi:hypothetical protein